MNCGECAWRKDIYDGEVSRCKMVSNYKRCIKSWKLNLWLLRDGYFDMLLADGCNFSCLETKFYVELMESLKI